MKTPTEKIIRILCALFAVLMMAPANAVIFYDPTDVGCDRMSNFVWVFGHILSLALPLIGGGIMAYANDCNVGGWAYWLFAAPIAFGLFVALPGWLLVGIVGWLCGKGGRSAHSPFIVGILAFALTLSMTSTVQAEEWDDDISRMQKDIVAAMSPYGENANVNFFVSLVIADAGMSVCWGAAQIAPHRKISINAIDVVRAFYENAAKGKIDRNASLAIMRNCVRESITALESQNVPPHKIRTLVFGKIDNSISAWRTKKFWFDAGLRMSDMAKAKQ